MAITYEITSGPGDGDFGYPLLMLFPIITPITWAGTSTKVVPTPASMLPEWAVALLTASELTDLDSGDAMFYVYGPFKTYGLTNPQMLAKAQALYTQLQVARQTWYENVYKYPGNRMNVS